MSLAEPCNSAVFMLSPGQTNKATSLGVDWEVEGCCPCALCDWAQVLASAGNCTRTSTLVLLTDLRVVSYLPEAI